MTVSIIASPTVLGLAFSDGLNGGGTGYYFGSSEAGQTPSLKNIYLRHDGASKIWNLSIYLKSYSKTYGGDYSASDDLVKALDQGAVGAGFQIDFVWNNPPFTTYSIITAALGGSPLTAILLPASAIKFSNGGSPVAATAPVAGELGQVGNTTLGDTALLKCRWAVPEEEVAPGKRQIDLAFVYNFTT